MIDTKKIKPKDGIRDILKLNTISDSVLDQKSYRAINEIVCLHSSGEIHLNIKSTGEGLKSFLEAFKPETEQEEKLALYLYSIVESAFVPLSNIKRIINLFAELGDPFQREVCNNIITGKIPISADIGISNREYVDNNFIPNDNDHKDNLPN